MKNDTCRTVLMLRSYLYGRALTVRTYDLTSERDYLCQHHRLADYDHAPRYHQHFTKSDLLALIAVGPALVPVIHEV